MKRIIYFLLLFAFATSQVQAQNITDSATLRNLTNQWLVPNGNISAVKLNSLLNGVLNVQSAGNSTLLVLVKKWADSITAHNVRINNKWSLTGDSISSGNFIGTNNDQDLVFKRNGSFAGYLDSLQKNTFLGVGVNQPGAGTINNTGIGYYALHGNKASYNNTAVGIFSLQTLRGNDQNTAVGAGSGAGVLQSFGSTYIGYNAGSAITDHHYYSTFLGWNAGSTQLNGGNNIFIGANTQPNISINNSNQLNIGNWVYGDSGKIGIGIKTPDSLFQVNGGLKFVTGRQGAGKVLVSDANGGADWQTINTTGGGGSSGNDISGEPADNSSNTTITLTHTALPNSVKLIKNGVRLPPFKYSVSGTIITLTDTRIPSDIFLTDYKF